MFTGGPNNLGCNSLMDSVRLESGALEELAVNAALSADGFAVQIDKRPVSCFFFFSFRTLLDTETSSALLLATVSRKCLPSAPRCSLFLLHVNKLFYSLSGLGGREGGGGGRCCGDTEREVKSVFRNVPGQASGWHSPDDCEGILGRGKPGNPVQHLQPFSLPPPSFFTSPSPSLSFPSFPVLSSQSVHLCLWSRSQPVCHKKTLYNRRGTVMGKQSYVRLVEHGKQQNLLLHISAASAGRLKPKSLVSSTVSNLNSKNSHDSKF